MSKSKETQNYKKNNKDHGKKDETIPAQEQNTQNGELLKNFDYNSITNFFVKRIDEIILDEIEKSEEGSGNDSNIEKTGKDGCKKKVKKLKRSESIGNLLIILSVLFAIIPLFEIDILKKYTLCIAFIFYVVSFLVILRKKSNLPKDFNIGSKFLYDKLDKNEVDFLKHENIYDELIVYLENGLEDVEKYVLGIIGIFVTLYTLYNSLPFFCSKLDAASYAMLVLGLAIIGFINSFKSYERTLFLNLLQHIKVEGIMGINRNKKPR